MRRIKLDNAILNASTSSDLSEAYKEFQLHGITYGNSHCECGMAIKKIVYVKNVNTEQVLTIGSDCIEKFFGMESSIWFKALEKIRKTQKVDLTEDMVKFLDNVLLINSWEKEFLTNILSYKSIKYLSDKQKAKLKEVLKDVMKKAGVLEN